ncbi:MAG: beta-ketoacyl-ACP synthase III [Actinomycetota bacterium]
MSAPIKAPEGAQFARILATGSYRPSRVVTNDEICQTIDSSDEWIRERSGIIERRWAGDDETVATMSAAAAEKALAAAGLASQDIDVIIVATCTHPYQTPTAASEIASMIGVPTAAALDISAACAGFTYGLSMAQDMIRGGSARHVLLVGAEKLSAFTDIYDRSTAFIFADGAGAVVVGPSSTPAISPVVWGGDGDQLQAINMTQNWVDFKANGFDTFPAISMNGQQVFRWAVSEMTRVCRESLETAGITVEDLDAFIPHQANNRITDALVRALELPDSVAVARDIITTGNTSAASIPLAMDRMLASGEIHQGGNALLVGFGAGLVFASEVVTLP